MIGVAVKDACQTLLKDTTPRITKEALAGAAASLKVPSRACRRSVRVQAQCAANCEVWAPFPTPKSSARGNACETTCRVALLYRRCGDHHLVCGVAGAGRPPQVSPQLCPGNEPAASAMPTTVSIASHKSGSIVFCLVIPCLRPHSHLHSTLNMHLCGRAEGGPADHGAIRRPCTKPGEAPHPLAPSHLRLRSGVCGRHCLC